MITVVELNPFSLGWFFSCHRRYLPIPNRSSLLLWREIGRRPTLRIVELLPHRSIDVSGREVKELGNEFAVADREDSPGFLPRGPGIL